MGDKRLETETRRERLLRTRKGQTKTSGWPSYTDSQSAIGGMCLWDLARGGTIGIRLLVLGGVLGIQMYATEGRNTGTQ